LTSESQLRTKLYDKRDAFNFPIVNFPIRNPASKSLQSTEISLYLAFTNELNVDQKEKILMND
jgi:hypothetical protein